MLGPVHSGSVSQVECGRMSHADIWIHLIFNSAPKLMEVSKTSADRAGAATPAWAFLAMVDVALQSELFRM